jgi:hypothetical protein
MRYFPGAAPARVVNTTGARARAVLVAVGPNNRGLRIQIVRSQTANAGGPVDGPFRVLDAGSDRHAAVLRELGDRITDAEEVLRLVRRGHPQCVSVVNARSLVVEENRPAAGARLGPARDSFPADPTEAAGVKPLQGG